MIAEPPNEHPDDAIQIIADTRNLILIIAANLWPLSIAINAQRK
jgi:PIN domain nuclease of toxin-antitoxin system